MELRPAQGAGLSASLRDRKKAATRRALREAALKLFSSRGFAETSVDQIAAQAEVSRSTFFRYFGSKEAVLFAESDERGEIFVGLLRDRPVDEGPVHAFEEALIQLSNSTVTASDREAARQMESLFQRDPALSPLRSALRTRWTVAVAEAFARRRGAQTVGESDSLAAGICMAVADQIGRDWREGDPGYGVEDAIRKGFATLRGIVGAESSAGVA